MAMSKIIRAGLMVLILVILLSTAFLAGMGNTRALQEAAYQAGYEDGRGPTAAASAPAPEEDVTRAPELLVVGGTVVAVSAQGIDVRSEDGETHSFSIDAATTFVAVVQEDATAAPREETITIADIAVGDAVAVSRQEGSQRAARIVRTLRAADAPAPEADATPLDPPPPEMVQPQ